MLKYCQWILHYDLNKTYINVDNENNNNNNNNHNNHDDDDDDDDDNNNNNNKHLVFTLTHKKVNQKQLETATYTKCNSEFIRNFP